MTGLSSDPMILTDHDSWANLQEHWDFSKNVSKPEELTHASHSLVWWICENFHSFQKQIAGATNGRTALCVLCTKIPTTHPHLLDEWDYEKNDRLPESVGSGAGHVWWICKEGHSYSMAVHNKIKGKRCPICYGTLVIPGVNDLGSKYPELIVDYSTVNPKKISEVFFKYGLALLWTCTEEHTYRRTVELKLRKSYCPYCSNEKLLEGYNSLFMTHPELIEEWSPRNTSDPEKLFWLSGETAYWICADCDYEFESKISRRAKKENSCAVCVGNVILEGVNDLTTFAPHLLQFLDSEKNDRDPGEMGKGRPVWWKCEEGHSYLASPSAKLKGYGFCKTCKPFSRPERAVRELVQEILGDTVSVIGNTRDIIKPFELDIYIPSLSKAIEFNGDYWHSDKMMLKTRGVTAHEYHQMKLRLALEHDVETMFVWESEWIKNRESVTEKIREFLSRKWGWYLV